jgi:hypothetical protein
MLVAPSQVIQFALRLAFQLRACSERGTAYPLAERSAHAIITRLRPSETELVRHRSACRSFAEAVQGSSPRCMPKRAAQWLAYTELMGSTEQEPGQTGL